MTRPGVARVGGQSSEAPVTRSRFRPSPRLIAAIAAGKGVARTSRLLGRGGGASLPGLVARRIDPRVLARLIAAQPVRAVAVTGSNGKTTTSRLAAARLRGEGNTVAHNSAGANLIQGVTSLAVNAASISGTLPIDVFLAEVDEGALLQVAPEMSLEVLVVTSLFRDQLDRFGEIYALARAIESVAVTLPPESTVIVNGDDPMVADMAHDRTGRRLTFGLDVAQSFDRISGAADSIRCPRCRGDLRYDQVYLSHLGSYRCGKCGYGRPTLDVAVTDVAVRGLQATDCTVRTPTGEYRLSIPQAGIHVAYNAAAALAICHALEIPVPHASTSLASVRPAFGRMEHIHAGGYDMVMAFAKNPTSFNTTLRTLEPAGEPRHLLTAFSNTLVDGEDFGWLWDVDLESIADRLQQVTVSGLRCDELATRLKYAGVAADRITVVSDRPAALDHALATVPAGERLSIVSGYTPTIEFRQEMFRRGWVQRYWRT
jgi:lipid II isoglutaminyl synthase (glutamine-hydrolysing)